MNRKAAFAYHDSLSRHVLRPDHPLQAVRLRYTYELLEAYKAFDDVGAVLIEPRPATDKEIQSFHDPEYVEAVKSLSLGERGHDLERFNFSMGGDNPVFDGMYEAAALSTGASVEMARLIGEKETSVAFNISGGLHHAAAKNASGFCVFNDPVIAINQLLAKGMKAVYVDIDAHHGDGVQNAFFDTDQVLTISIHESGMFLFPGTGSVQEMGTGSGNGYSVNVPLYPYTDDDTYLWAFREIVPPLVEAFNPDVLVTQLGIDSYHSDPLAHLLLSSEGFVEAVKEFSQMGLPWLAMGGGGYDLGGVARCWALAYGVMLGREWPDAIPSQYREKYGFERLRDADISVVVPDDVTKDVKSFAAQSVDMVKQLIFPIHKIS